MVAIDEYIHKYVMPELKIIASNIGEELVVTEKEIKAIWTQQQGRCAYSGIKLDPEQGENSDSYPQLAPKDLYKGTQVSNLCFVCNFIFVRFLDISPSEMYDWCLKIMRTLYSKVEVLNVSGLQQR